MNNDYLTADYLNEAIRRYETEAEFHSRQTLRYRMKYVRWPGSSTIPLDDLPPSRPLGRGVGGEGKRLYHSRELSTELSGSPHPQPLSLKGERGERVSMIPLIFIHGMNDQVRSFAMVMAELVDRGFTCIGYELPDGRDGANLGAIQHHHYMDDLIAFLDDLQLNQAILVGSSFGTTIALRTMAKHPDRVHAAILKGGFARRPLERWQRGLSRLGRYWHFTMSELLLRETVLERFEKQQFIGCPDAVFRFLLQCSGTTPCRAAARRTLLIDKLDLRPLLPNIRHEVLMIGGDRDTIVPRECEREVEEGLPNVRRLELEQCGHYPQYTRPRQTAEAIAEFLQKGSWRSA